MCGTVIVAACLALLSVVVAVFVTVSRSYAVAMCGAESAWDPFSFDGRHQLFDEEIGLVEFVGRETAGGAVTVTSAGRRGCCDAELLQLSHGGQNSVVLCGDWCGQCLHHDGASSGCGRQGAEVSVKLLHEGDRGARDVAPRCSRRGRGCDIVDKGGGVCRTKGVAAARYQSRFPFESFVEGEKLILPCL